MKGRKTSVKKESILDAYRASRETISRWLLRGFVRADEIEDVLQEAFLRAYEAEAAGLIESPRAYLFVTARNIVYKDMKRRARYVSDAIDEISSPDPAAPPDIAVHDRRKMAAFLEAMNSLPEQCRRVFLLRKFYGYSHKKIARELGISEKTVENHLVNGLKRCGSWMKSKGFDDVPQSRAQKNAAETRMKNQKD